MAFLHSFDISGSALTAQKFRMNIIAQNLANANTTRTEGGGPYRRKLVVLSERASFGQTLGAELAGVKVSAVAQDEDDFKLEYDPTHPDANENGYVELPNINTLEEMIDMMSASRAYDANITALGAMKELASAALSIGK